MTQSTVDPVPDPTKPRPALLWLALVVIGIGWGITGPLSKLAVSTGNHPIGVTFWETVIGAVVVLLVAGVIGPGEAFSGFSNPAPITVAALYVVARAVEKTGALQPIVSWVLGEGTSLRGSLARLLVPSAGASAFLNNTPIVAMLVPQLTEWADRHGRSVSYFLMPLSFVAMLGGLVILIGTSTNLVVSGLLEAHGYAPLGMFELAPVGLPLAAVGILVIVVLGRSCSPSAARRARRSRRGRGCASSWSAWRWCPAGRSTAGWDRPG